MYKATDLRYKTKEILDKAKAGETIQIERDRVNYTLMREDKLEAVGTVLKRIKALEDRLKVLEHTPTNESIDLSSPFAQQALAEQQYCALPAPCKHWTWDVSSGEGYKNSLSGRIREA